MTPDLVRNKRNVQKQNLPTDVLPSLQTAMINSLTTLLCLIPRQEPMTPLLDTSRWPESHAAHAEGGRCGERAGLALTEGLLGEKGGD